MRNIILSAFAALLLVACPYEDYVAIPLPSANVPDTGGSTVDNTVDYDLGYSDGFAQDDWYWDGYYDGYDTFEGGPLYYYGSEIPFVDDPAYDAGYWDGVWVAYNDGYFVDYHHAFTIGFSEGYDNAFAPDYLDFLANDVHVEWLDGGWSDGYDDGFSEGRIFGAADYEAGWAFDWATALYDYEGGIDLEFVEVSVGTEGSNYPVVELYEYGLDPNDIINGVKSAVTPSRRDGIPAIRHGGENTKAITDDMIRPFTSEAQTLWEYTPSTSIRSDRPLRLTDDWLTRIEAYQNYVPSAAKNAGTRYEKRLAR